MTIGYDQPLYILPFDHRHSYGEQVFGFHDPLSDKQIAVVAHSKSVIFQGFKRAIAAGAPKDCCGILVDEEFGAAILRDAVANGFITCMPTEKSGQHEFDFEYGNDFRRHIEEFNPTFTKVLVRLNPEGDAEANSRQAVRLRELCDYLHARNCLFMFELLVPAERSQLDRVGGDASAYDLQLRPGLMARAIRELQDAGIEPDVWKVEGLDRADDCRRIVEVARRGGRDRVGVIVLGRGEDESHVLHWLATAATVPGFIGFAVGRSTFLEPIIKLRGGWLTEEAVVAEVARRFGEWIDAFEQARAG